MPSNGCSQKLVFSCVLTVSWSWIAKHWLVNWNKTSSKSTWTRQQQQQKKVHQPNQRYLARRRKKKKSIHLSRRGKDAWTWVSSFAKQANSQSAVVSEQKNNNFGAIMETSNSINDSLDSSRSSMPYETIKVNSSSSRGCWRMLIRLTGHKTHSLFL